MKTFHIVTSAHSCTELIVETNHARKYLEGCNLREINKAEEADLVLVSTCSFNQEFEDEAFDNIRNSIKIRKGEAKVLVVGCFPQVAPLSFEQIKDDVVAIPPREMKKIEELVPSEIHYADVEPHRIDINEMLKNEVFMIGVRLKKFFGFLERWVPFCSMPTWLDSLPMTDWYMVHAGNGCMGNCTFCAIKHARGKIQSTPIDVIIPQVEKAVKEGFTTISFAGTDMGCWGYDLGLNLADLLNEVAKVKGDFHIDMHYVEPEWVMKLQDKLFPIFESGLVKTFGSPVQSGSNRILKLMGRGYTVEQYIDMVNHVIDKTKVRSMNSIVMVGFPSETVEDYLDTYNLIDKVKISYWCLLRYEGRHKVASERIEPKIPDELKDYRRMRLVRKVQLRNYLGIPHFMVEPIVNMAYGKMK